ncbi:MAG: response regulator transcription factor [Caulobacterales bacterium]|nr:response regulator transcription factor [Caulobacterales bacterium]
MTAPDGPLIVVIDDHPLVRDALTLAARRAEPSAQVLGFAGLDAAFGGLTEDPDLVLLDLDLGEGGDLSNLMTIAKHFAQTPVGIVSATERPDVIRRARDLGAAGYVPKSAGLPELESAVRAWLQGRLVYPDGLDAEDGDAGGDAARLASLTPTQIRVLNALRRGLLNKQIAFDLAISEATVKAHMTAIFRKLGVNNRTQALLVARQLDAQPPGDGAI